jgi:hypothetical protein
MYLHVARTAHKKNLDSDPTFYSIGETQSTKSYVYRVLQPIFTTTFEINTLFRSGLNLELKLPKLPSP